MSSKSTSADRPDGEQPPPGELLGEVTGDAIAEAITLLDGLVVIGGGIAGAHRQFLPAIVAEMNGSFAAPNGALPRIVPQAFNLEENSVGVIILGEYLEIREGDEVRSTGELLRVPVERTS